MSNSHTIHLLKGDRMQRRWRKNDGISSGMTLLGIVLLLTISGLTPAQTLEPSSIPYREVVASNGGLADSFGYSLDVDGIRMVVGMAGDTPLRAAPGMVYVYDWTIDHEWSETILWPSDEAESRAMSYSVAVSGDRIVAGGPYTEHVYLFESDGSGGWVESTIASPDSTPGDWFGHAVAISGDRIVVGAPLDSPNGESSGSAYVFDYDGSTWSATQLTPSDGLPRDEFGWSVAVGGDIVVVGQPHRFCCDVVDSEAVYVFESDGAGGWNETKLVASDHTDGDSFGFSVAVEGTLVAVGAPRPNGVGAVYLYSRQGPGSWSETKLQSAESIASDDFGWAVDVLGGQVAVGAPHKYNEVEPAGAAHVFKLTDPAIWTETFFQDPGFEAASYPWQRWFGHSVGLSTNSLAVGAPHADTIDWDAGAIYEFSESIPGPNTFIDDDGNSHEANIEFIAANGITKGCNPPLNDMYCPEGSITRGEMAAFLDRALGLPETDIDFFSDDDASLFEAHIDRLAAAGITTGCNPPDNNRFCPGNALMRGEMAAFLVRAFGYTAGSGLDLFIDDDGSVFEADIDRLGTAGATQGCNPPDNNRFCPNDPVRRDEMASFLARALNGV